MNLPILRPCLWSACLAFFLLGFTGCADLGGGLRPGAFSTVVIDAGHGGKDSGESPNQLLREKDMALDTARRLQSILRRNGLRTVMTRTGDYFVELDDRVDIADRYGPRAILVSLHYDASRGYARGAHVNFWRQDSYGLAMRVQRHLIGNTGLANRGVVRRVLRLTRNPSIPSILCECGFLTNQSDASQIRTPEFRQRIAQGIAEGILEQQERGDVNIGTLPPPERPVVPRPSYTHHTGSSHRETMARVRSREGRSGARGRTRSTGRTQVKAKGKGKATKKSTATSKRRKRR